jgi:hypothetical protein
MINFIYSIAAIVIYFICAHFIVEFIMFHLWKCIGKHRKAHRLTASLGFIDRIIYAVCFAVKGYAFIGVWLGIKVVSRLVSYRDPTGKDMSMPEREKAFREEGERKNVYLIGNAISLVLGILGGIFIKVVFDHQLATLEGFLK